MDPRTELILQKCIKDFIDTGRPITSDYLYENYEFGIKPAMIRRELSILDEEGYLEQIHTSGGRFPTNKAYQYFVDKVLKKEEKKRKTNSKTDSMANQFLSGEIDLFLDSLSEFLTSLGVLYEPKQRRIYDSGLESLFESLRWDSRDEVINIIRDIESIAKTLEENNWWEVEDQWPRIFIGENPLIRSDHISIVANKFKINGNNEFVLLTIGPKRMDYEKTFNMLKYLEEVINKKQIK